MTRPAADRTLHTRMPDCHFPRYLDETRDGSNHNYILGSVREWISECDDLPTSCCRTSLPVRVIVIWLFIGIVGACQPTCG